MVAGQIDRCLRDSDRVTTVLLGFNPVERARTVAIEGWDKTFRAVVDDMCAVQQRNASAVHFVLPVVGPEPITGSTRMKGGSATKIILDSIFTMAHASIPPSLHVARALVQEYAMAVNAAYRPVADIAMGIDVIGSTLKAGGRVAYLGQDSLGVFAMVDASECVPTYNAKQDDVRAFLFGGFAALENTEGNLETHDSAYRLSWDAFADTFLPTLSASDAVVCITADKLPVEPQLWALAAKAHQQSIKLVHIHARETEGEVCVMSCALFFILTSLLHADICACAPLGCLDHCQCAVSVPHCD